MKAQRAVAKIAVTESPYAGFEQINGEHPWKKSVPTGYLEYEVRVLRDSKVVFFNFALAKEMGLIAQDHPHSLNHKLERKLVDTFALRVRNEYEILNGIEYPKHEMKPNKYMATRYLQLQHDCKMGTTSGDGRSIWNGAFTNEQGTSWDISSCGTGVTRLSPGFALHGKPIMTGDPKVCYGSGLADIDEGLTAAILSESFHKRGFETERTLVILATSSGSSINVRAAQNLLRPSHLFLHLKQGNQLQLKSALDYHLARSKLPRDYDKFLENLARDYGKFVARLEDEYIFCWLDWDGDNMLMNAGIIDYGSIRQFGLCHHLYRYDDVTRFSTNLKEQKTKAKYLVQTFIQLVDFVKTGQKQAIRSYQDSKYVKLFQQSYHRAKRFNLLHRMGFNRGQAELLEEKSPALVRKFMEHYTYFEQKESPRGTRKTPDGVNCPAIFDAHNLLRELPKRYLLEEKLLSAEELLLLLHTPFVTKKMAKETSKYRHRAEQFQKAYLALLRAAAGNEKPKMRKCLLSLTMRASQRNRTDYATGDGIIYVVNELLKQKKKMQSAEFIHLVEHFIAHQTGQTSHSKLQEKSQKVMNKLLQIVEKNRYSL